MSKKQTIGLAVYAAVDMGVMLLLLLTMLKRGSPWEYITAGYMILSGIPVLLFARKLKKQREKTENRPNEKPKDRDPWEK